MTFFGFSQDVSTQLDRRFAYGWRGQNHRCFWNLWNHLISLSFVLLFSFYNLLTTKKKTLRYKPSKRCKGREWGLMVTDRGVELEKRGSKKDGEGETDTEREREEGSMLNMTSKYLITSVAMSASPTRLLFSHIHPPSLGLLACLCVLLFLLCAVLKLTAHLMSHDKNDYILIPSWKNWHMHKTYQQEKVNIVRKFFFFNPSHWR